MNQLMRTPYLTGLVQNLRVPPTSLAAQWFPRKGVPGKTYGFDLLEGNRGIAKYRDPNSEAGRKQVMKRTRKTVVLPNIREKKHLDEEDIRTLDGLGKTQPEAAAAQVKREMMDLDDIIERTHEKARWDLLVSGQVVCDIEGESVPYNFGIGTSGSPSVTWDNLTTSTPLANIDAWKHSIKVACGVEPTEIILGDTAIRYIAESTEAQKHWSEATKKEYFDTGTIKVVRGLRIINVEDGYHDDSGNFKYYLSDDGAEANMCVIKTPGSVGWTVEGGVNDSEAPDNHIGKFAKSWAKKDPSGRWLLETHRCLPGLTLTKNLGAFTLW